MRRRVVFAGCCGGYWIVGRGEVEVVVVRVLEGAVASLLVSGVGHLLQLFEVEDDDGDGEHSDGPEGGDDGAEDVGGDALGVVDGNGL